MSAPPIYDPVIPCVHPLPNGFYPGCMIRVQGNTPPGAQRFAINLQCGPNTDPRDDIALHLNFRFVEMCIVRNHLTALSWGVEDTAGGMPLVPGQAFEILILCEPQCIKIAVNGVHFCEFPHRIPIQRISHITVDGDCSIRIIGFEGAQPPQQYMGQPPAYGAYGAPPPAYGAPAPGYGQPQGPYTGGENPEKSEKVEADKTDPPDGAQSATPDPQQTPETPDVLLVQHPKNIDNVILSKAPKDKTDEKKEDTKNETLQDKKEEIEAKPILEESKALGTQKGKTSDRQEGMSSVKDVSKTLKTDEIKESKTKELVSLEKEQNSKIEIVQDETNDLINNKTSETGEKTKSTSNGTENLQWDKMNNTDKESRSEAVRDLKQEEKNTVCKRSGDSINLDEPRTLEQILAQELDNDFHVSGVQQSTDESKREGDSTFEYREQSGIFDQLTEKKSEHLLKKSFDHRLEEQRNITQQSIDYIGPLLSEDVLKESQMLSEQDDGEQFMEESMEVDDLQSEVDNSLTSERSEITEQLSDGEIKVHSLFSPQPRQDYVPMTLHELLSNTTISEARDKQAEVQKIPAKPLVIEESQFIALVDNSWTSKYNEVVDQPKLTEEPPKMKTTDMLDHPKLTEQQSKIPEVPERLVQPNMESTHENQLEKQDITKWPTEIGGQEGTPALLMGPSDLAKSSQTDHHQTTNKLRISDAPVRTLQISCSDSHQDVADLQDKQDDLVQGYDDDFRKLDELLKKSFESAAEHTDEPEEPVEEKSSVNNLQSFHPSFYDHIIPLEYVLSQNNENMEHDNAIESYDSLVKSLGETWKSTTGYDEIEKSDEFLKISSQHDATLEPSSDVSKSPQASSLEHNFKSVNSSNLDYGPDENLQFATSEVLESFDQDENFKPISGYNDIKQTDELLKDSSKHDPGPNLEPKPDALRHVLEDALVHKEITIPSDYDDSTTNAKGLLEKSSKHDTSTVLKTETGHSVHGDVTKCMEGFYDNNTNNGANFKTELNATKPALSIPSVKDDINIPTDSYDDLKKSDELVERDAKCEIIPGLNSVYDVPKQTVKDYHLIQSKSSMENKKFNAIHGYNEIQNIDKVLINCLKCEPDPPPEPDTTGFQENESAVVRSEATPLIENYPSTEIQGNIIEPIRLRDSGHLQTESPSRHSDPGMTDAGTRKAFKDELKYLAGHPQFKYLDVVSSANKIENKVHDSEDGQILNVSSLTSGDLVYVDQSLISDSILYEDSQICVRKPQRNESGISQLENHSIIAERRNSYGQIVEQIRTKETALVIKDDDETVLKTTNIEKEEVVITSKVKVQKSVEFRKEIDGDKRGLSDDKSRIQLGDEERQSSELITKDIEILRPRSVEFKQKVQHFDEETRMEKEKHGNKDPAILTSNMELGSRNPSVQLLNRIQSVHIAADVSSEHSQDVNGTSVFSIYMTPNNSNGANQVQTISNKEFKITHPAQRPSNENMPIKSIKKSSDQNLIEQRRNIPLNIHQVSPEISNITPRVKQDSVDVPEISRTVKKEDISKPDAPKIETPKVPETIADLKLKEINVPETLPAEISTRSEPIIEEMKKEAVILEDRSEIHTKTSQTIVTHSEIVKPISEPKPVISEIKQIVSVTKVPEVSVPAKDQELAKPDKKPKASKLSRTRSKIGTKSKKGEPKPEISIESDLKLRPSLTKTVPKDLKQEEVQSPSKPADLRPQMSVTTTDNKKKDKTKTSDVVLRKLSVSNDRFNKATRKQTRPQESNRTESVSPGESFIDRKSRRRQSSPVEDRTRFPDEEDRRGRFRRFADALSRMFNLNRWCNEEGENRE